MLCPDSLAQLQPNIGQSMASGVAASSGPTNPPDLTRGWIVNYEDEEPKDYIGNYVDMDGWMRQVNGAAQKQSAYQRRTEHKNENPIHNWVYHRSQNLVPPGSWAKIDTMRTKGNTLRLLYKGGQPNANRQPIELDYSIYNRQLNWRSASPEDLPRYDWFHATMPYGKVCPTWFDRHTSWEVYNKRERQGEGFSAYFLGLFKTLEDAKNGFGFSNLMMGPYEVACAIIEDTRHVRNDIGIFHLRPAFFFDRGFSGVRSEQLLTSTHPQGGYRTIEYKPLDPRILLAYAAKCMVQIPTIFNASTGGPFAGKFMQSSEHSSRSRALHFSYRNAGRPLFLVSNEDNQNKSLVAAQFVPAEWVFSDLTSTSSIAYGERKSLLYDLGILDNEKSISDIEACENISNLAFKIGITAQATGTAFPDIPVPEGVKLRPFPGEDAIRDGLVGDDAKALEVTRREGNRARAVHHLTDLYGELPFDLSEQQCIALSTPGKLDSKDGARYLYGKADDVFISNLSILGSTSHQFSPEHLGNWKTRSSRVDESSQAFESYNRGRSAERSRGASAPASRGGRRKLHRSSSGSRSRSASASRARSTSMRRMNRRNPLTPSNPDPGPFHGSSASITFVKNALSKTVPLVMTSNIAEHHSIETSRSKLFGTYVGSAHGVPLLDDNLYEQACLHLGTHQVPGVEETSPASVPTPQQLSDVREILQSADSPIVEDLQIRSHAPEGETVEQRDEYLAELQERWKLRQKRLLKSFRAAIQWHLDPSSYCSAWWWAPRPSIPQLRLMFSKPDFLANHDVEYWLDGGQQIKLQSGSTLTHLALVIQYLAVSSGIMTTPVVFNVGTKDVFTGVAIQVSQSACDASPELQSDPQAGAPFSIVLVGYRFNKHCNGPIFDVVIPQDEDLKKFKKGEPALHARFKVKALTRVALPAAWVKTFEYAFGCLATMDKTDNSQLQSKIYTNLGGTSEKHIVEGGVPNKGFCRISAPGIPMTTAWYAWAANADCLAGMQPRHRPVFLYTLRTFTLQNPFRNDAHSMAVTPLGSSSMEIFRGWQCAENNCIALFVYRIAQSQNAPTYLRNFRQNFVVETSRRGEGFFTATAAHHLRTGGTVNIDALHATVPQTYPHDLDAEELLSEDDSYLELNDKYDPEAHDHEYFTKTVDIVGPMELFFSTADPSVKCGKAVLEPLPKHCTIGGPGFGLMNSPLIWGDVIDYRARNTPENPPVLQTPTANVFNMLKERKFPTNELVEIPNPSFVSRHPEAATKDPIVANADRPMREICALIYTFLEIRGFAESLELDSDADAMQLRVSFLDLLSQATAHPAFLHGIKAVQFAAADTVWTDLGHKAENVARTNCLRMPTGTYDYVLNTDALVNKQKECLQRWQLQSAIDRMTEWDKIHDFYTDQSGEHELLGFGLVCLGKRMGTVSKSCCRSHEGCETSFCGLSILRWVLCPDSRGPAEQMRALSALATPLLKHMMSYDHVDCAVSRFYFHQPKDRFVTEVNALQERIAVTTCVAIADTGPNVDMVTFANGCKQTWTDFAMIGKEPGTARLPVNESTFADETWPEDVRALLGNYEATLESPARMRLRLRPCLGAQDAF